MRRLPLWVFGLALLCLNAPRAFAQQGGFGVGLMVGDPNGLTLKVPLGSSQAIDARLGLQFNGVIDIQGNYLITPLTLLENGDLSLPLYFGGGARLILVDNVGAILGLRAPAGVALEFNAAPVEIFAELGLTLFFANDPFLDVDGVVGFHFYF
jgi:hypothetical protein